MGVAWTSRRRTFLAGAAALGLAAVALGVRTAPERGDTAGAATSPAFAVGSTAVVEGDTHLRTAYFPVTLSDPATTQVSVHFETLPGSAVAGQDFKPRSGTLNFKPNSSGVTPVRKFVGVQVYSDTTAESAETLSLALSGATGGATIAHPTGTATIIDDDPGSGVRVGVADAAIYEGDSGKKRTANLPVTLSDTSAAPVTVTLSLAPVTAGSPSDFKAVTKKVTFKPGQWKKNVPAAVFPDVVGEDDETASLTITAVTGASVERGSGTLTILDDDGGVISDPNATVVTAAGDLGDSQSAMQPVADQILALDPQNALALGDLVYPDGQQSGFDGFFDQTWGRFKSKIIAAPGNHEYHTANASGFYSYFPQPEYFATDIGTNGWRVYVLNCEIDCTAGSPQAAWVSWDIQSFPDRHRFAIVHRPRFTSSTHSDYSGLAAIWDTLAAGGGEFMLAGHNHAYERFAPMSGTGTVSTSGMRQFVVGTGGAGLYSFNAAHTGEEFRDNTHLGVLRMELGSSSYSWRFIGTNGDLVDTGSQATK